MNFSMHTDTSLFPWIVYGNKFGAVKFLSELKTLSSVVYITLCQLNCD